MTVNDPRITVNTFALIFIYDNSRVIYGHSR